MNSALRGAAGGVLHCNLGGVVDIRVPVYGYIGQRFLRMWSGASGQLTMCHTQRVFRASM